MNKAERVFEKIAQEYKYEDIPDWEEVAPKGNSKTEGTIAGAVLGSIPGALIAHKYFDKIPARLGVYGTGILAGGGLGRYGLSKFVDNLHERGRKDYKEQMKDPERRQKFMEAWIKKNK